MLRAYIALTDPQLSRLLFIIPHTPPEINAIKRSPSNRSRSWGAARLSDFWLWSLSHAAAAISQPAGEPRYFTGSGYHPEGQIHNLSSGDVKEKKTLNIPCRVTLRLPCSEAYSKSRSSSLLGGE